MKPIDRRTFLRQAGMAGAAALVTPPTILTPRRTRPRTARGSVVFRPHYVQRGVGPNLLDWAYASDAKWDAFRSDITASHDGVVITDARGEERFGVNVRWNVEGFGYLFLTADNGGEFYTLPPEGETTTFNLNAELARSRVVRNRERLGGHGTNGWRPSREVRAHLDLSEGYYEDALKAGDEAARGARAQQALYYALVGGEMLELEKARDEIRRRGTRDHFFAGCDARSFYQMDPDVFLDRFTELFDYATITYYQRIGHDGVPDFEPVRGDKRFDTRDALFRRLKQRGVTVEGRPILYPYPSVTPDWMRELSYDDLLRYVERHTREMVGHYGDEMYAWEIVNEFHDWANEVNVTPEQAVEVTRLACDVAKATAPNVHRLINNCCPYAEYVQLGTYQDRPATYPQRTPWEFMKDLTDAGVDFTLTGQQMYFPYRDLQDILLMVERYRAFGRPVQLTEIGASSGPSDKTVKLGTVPLPTEPYPWHRPWDEELQADWAEAVYTLAYAQPYVEAVNWYDFVDGHDWIDNGGLVRDGRGAPKPIFERLKKLRAEWKALPPPPPRTGCPTC